MPDRKYVTEFAMNALITRMGVLQQNELIDPALLEFFDSAHPCHVYMIARRPRISINRESLVVTSETLSMTFAVSTASSAETIQWTGRNLLGTTDVHLESEYPFTIFRLSTTSGDVLFTAKSAIFLQQYSALPSPHLDLEVLYVGQSYGTDGEGTALSRLESHSTLQSIYADAMAKTPHMDVWLVLCHVESLLVMSMDPRQATTTTVVQDTDHIRETVHNPLSEHQAICFAEAGLIRYFQPEYNVLLKGSFPNPAHKSYSECYALDLNAVMIEVQSEAIRARLWSATVPPQWVHMRKYELHGVDDRRSMFEFYL